MKCTTCNCYVGHEQSAICGIEREGKMVWVWGCEHHPVGDAAVILASHVCADMWLDNHPEYHEAVYAMIERAGGHLCDQQEKPS